MQETLHFDLTVNQLHIMRSEMFNRTLAVAGMAALVALPLAARADDAPAAPAAPAAPLSPLGKILDGTGITVSSYLDLAYSHANKNVEAYSDRVFDAQNDSMTLHQAGLQIAKQPKEGFGGLINVTAGKDSQVIASYPYGAGSQFDVTQAYGQYATGALTVIAGKFTTLHGTEVIWAPSNNNYSRSILFGSVPFTHTGVRATYVASDTVTVIGGVNNGWDQLSDSNKTKTIELGAIFTPIKPLTVIISDYVGKESATGLIDPAATQGTRNSFNLVASYAVSDPLTVGIEYLNVSQSDFATSTGTTKAKYNGFAGYLTYMFTPAYRLALRAESLNDKDGFRFGVNDTKYSEFTATFSYLATDNFEVRGELRGDKSSNNYFKDFSGSTSKSLFTYGVEALFKF
jgi:hypothetical protein